MFLKPAKFCSLAEAGAFPCVEIANRAQLVVSLTTMSYRNANAGSDFDVEYALIAFNIPSHSGVYVAAKINEL